MSNSKARFQPGASGSTVKNPVTKGSVTGSKRTVGGNPTASGFGTAGSKASSQVQVIFNGKILTPQSLIQRKGPSHGPSDVHKKAKADIGFDAIDENAPEEKQALSTAPRKRLESSVGLTGGAAAHGQSSGPTGGFAKGQPAVQQHKYVVEEFCVIQLHESTTHMSFSMPSLVVASDTREVILTDERNSRYDALVKSRSNVDGFASRPTQTKNLPQKNQNEMAAPNALRDAGSQALAYDIKDATVGSDTSATDGDVVSGADGPGGEELVGLTTSVRKFITDTVGVALVTPGCLLDTTNVVKPLGYGELGAHGKGAKHKRAGASHAGGASKSMGGSVSGYTNTGAGGGPASGEDISNSGYFGPDANQNPKGSGGNHKSDSGTGHGASSGNNVVDAGAGASISASGANVGGYDAGGGGASGSRDGIAMGGGSSEAGGAGGATFTAEDTQKILRDAEIKGILSSPLLLKRLQMIERAIQQNANHRPQLDYRDLPDIEPLSLLSSERAKALQESSEGANKGFGGLSKGKVGMLGEAHGHLGGILGGLSSVGASAAADAASAKSDDDSPKAKVKKLFSYSNVDLIQGRSVTAMVWNAVSSDLLAVGYGKIDVISDSYKPGEALDEERQGGLVLFWSLRNPDYPEKILRTPQPVTALDFSKQNPMTLAVGLLNGDVNVYDVRREGANWGIPVESSAGMAGGHTDPVWQLKWIIKGVERLETLVSISTDGRVLEWNLKKGLVVSLLMQLKKSGMGEGWISNSAAGLSLDFHPTDPSTYITGTEDGSIHRCSVSYNEQYLDSYQNHEGPVYRIRFSSRWPSLFLTCSADWCLNMYHTAFRQPLLSMRGTGENFPINDISWCPDNSTVFANVTVDAKLQIWDLSISSIDPVVTVDTSLEEDPAAGTAGANAGAAAGTAGAGDAWDDEDGLGVAKDGIDAAGSPPGSPALMTGAR
ncbi:WD40-repeat-containing domain protein [Ochromonadaceae sp. CCMP2298]|nr:WD40-repeat-containing domain protein [Ochromonadaceae sp. CCMP2298]